MRLTFKVSGEPLWIALRSDWLSIYIILTSRGDTKVTCVLGISRFRKCARRLVVLLAVAELSVKIMDRMSKYIGGMEVLGDH